MSDIKAKLAGIYKITNLVNGNIYIGSAKQFKYRWNKHISELELNRHHAPHLQHAWNLYGKSKFLFEIIEIIDDTENLIVREQYWLDALKPSYNVCLTAFSPLGIKRSEETKRKMSEARKNRKPVSPETRLKMSASAKNKVISEQAKLNMSVAQKGRKHSEETKLKIALSHKGKLKSKEHLAKIWITRRANKAHA